MNSTSGWLPADYRRALDDWRATAPKRDSDIFSPPRKSMPRHAAKADRLRPLLTFRDPPTDEPLQTNWRTRPDNDNEKPDDFFVERRIEVIPSLPELARVFTPAKDTGIAAVEFRHVREARLQGGRAEHVEPGIISWPIHGDFEVEANNGKRIIRRLGSLHFSDGNNVERAQRFVPGGGIADYAARLPVGAMRYTVEKETAMRQAATAKEYQLAANLRIASLFGIEEVHEAPPAGRTKRRGHRLSHRQACEELAAAYANTPILPPIKQLPDGMPMATDDLSAIFMSLVKRPTGNSGASNWQDFATLSDFATAWTVVLDALPEVDKLVLEVAMTASSLAEVGRVAVCASGGFAERAGRIALDSANDNLALGLKKIAA